MKRKCALLVHSDEVGWPGLRRVLETIPTMNVAAETQCADEATAVAREIHPDIVLASNVLEDVPAYAVIAKLRPFLPPDNVVAIIAARLGPDDIIALESLGLSAFLLWSDLTNQAAYHGIQMLLNGSFTVASREAAIRYVNVRCGNPRLAQPLVDLTKRERRILQRRAQGLTPTEIARECEVSPRTVRRQILNLQHKLEVEDEFGLGMKAALFGLLS